MAFSGSTTFHGQPFELREALQLAKPRELAQKNKPHLQAAVRELLALLDSEQAEEFVRTLARK